MAQNLQMKKEKERANERISNFIIIHRLPVIAVTVAVIAAVLIASATSVAGARIRAVGLSKLDEVRQALLADSIGLSDEEKATRYAAALEAVREFTDKGGVVGAQANMLAAETAYLQEDFAAAKTYWEAAAKKAPKAYTAAPAYFNAGEMSEELGDTAAALENYVRAAADADFAFAAHAQFNVGRLHETAGNFAEANTAYQKLIDKMPTDTWAELAKSRQLTLRVSGVLSD